MAWSQTLVFTPGKTLTLPAPDTVSPNAGFRFVFGWRQGAHGGGDEAGGDLGAARLRQVGILDCSYAVLGYSPVPQAAARDRSGAAPQRCAVLGLQSELVKYQAKKDPRERRRECGATIRECDFLVQGGAPGNWWGKRVELYAMTAAQFLQFLEGKLQEIGVRKVAPEGDVLEKAFRRTWRLQLVQEAVDEALARSTNGAIIMPADLLKSSTH